MPKQRELRLGPEAPVNVSMVVADAASACHTVYDAAELAESP